jgi:hypothetical protein
MRLAPGAGVDAAGGHDRVVERDDLVGRDLDPAALRADAAGGDQAALHRHLARRHADVAGGAVGQPRRARDAGRDRRAAPVDREPAGLDPDLAGRGRTSPCWC